MGPMALAAGAEILRRVRDRVEDSRAYEVLAKPRFELAPVSLLGTIKFLMLLAVIVFAANWLIRWDERRDVNAWWREQIASKSSAVRGVLTKADPEISATDDDVIAAIGEADAKLETAERLVRTPPAQPAPGSERSCPLVRPECLR